MKPLQGLALLLLMQSAGEALSHFLQLPVPGPVVGMVLLLLALRWAPVQQAIAPAAGFLLTHLSLLFVPVGVGVMTHLALLGTHGLRLVVVIVLSTWIGMAVTALVLRLWQTPAPTPTPPKAGDAELR
ncbi:MAG: CidA/LrgA family protein [Giesbergeria sp.]|nr:CidA/LrgA family protein [Giesbergeria sp.]